MPRQYLPDVKGGTIEVAHNTAGELTIRFEDNGQPIPLPGSWGKFSQHQARQLVVVILRRIRKAVAEGQDEIPLRTLGEVLDASNLALEHLISKLLEYLNPAEPRRIKGTELHDRLIRNLDLLEFIGNSLGEVGVFDSDEDELVRSVFEALRKMKP